MAGWWAGKSRQFARHVTGRVRVAEREALEEWLTPAQLALFDGMHRADRRHGLDVARALRLGGHHDPDVLLAGLLHDCAKGPDVGLWHRVAWSLADRYGRRVRGLAERLPGFAVRLRTIDGHAPRSAELALAAGCTARAAELIRRQSEPTDSELREALRLADEAN